MVRVGNEWVDLGLEQPAVGCTRLVIRALQIQLLPRKVQVVVGGMGGTCSSILYLERYAVHKLVLVVQLTCTYLPFLLHQPTLE